MTQIVWLLSLTQFYLSLGLALLFMALDLGLAWVLLIYRILAWKNPNIMYAYRFWVRIFALCSAFAFAASLPVILNLGVIWPQLMNRAGEVVGPLLGLAIIITFIFKSSFLGSMLYGQRILSDLSHTLVLVMVALGSALVAYVIMAIFAWQQIPAGTELLEGHFVINDWSALFSGLTPFLFLLFFLSSILLAIALMMFVLARQSNIRPSNLGDHNILLFVSRFFGCFLALQILCAWFVGQEILSVQPSRLAAILPQWSNFSSEINLTFMSGLNPGLGEKNWLIVWPPNLTEIFNDLLQLNMLGKSGLNDSIGLYPPLVFTYVSARVVLILNIILVVLAFYIWHKAKKIHFEPNNLSRFGRALFYLGALLILILQALGWAHLLSGNLPYAVYGTLTLRELGTPHSFGLLLAILIATLVIYSLLIYGLFKLINHNIRFGVIPVKRERGNS